MSDFGQNLFNLIKQQYAGLNLVGFKDFDLFNVNQIEDSLLPLELSSQLKESLLRSNCILDVGFGGGFPLLPIAHSMKEVRCLGVDTRNKKVRAVREIAEHLSLKNVSVFHGNIDDFLIDKKVTVTFKAVGKIEKYLTYLHNQFPVDVFFYKGPSVWEEENLENYLSEGSISIIENLEYKLSNGSKRTLVGLRKRNVPRGTFENKIKISTVI